MKGISRIDSRNTHGWFVRVFRNGHTHSKMFSDGVHGGREEALKMAKKYKDEYEKNHPRTLAATRLRLKMPRNNTSGVVGVSDTHVRSRSGEKFPCFSVSWCPAKNVKRCKKFYYHKYDSREEAFEAAVKFRQEREKEILKGLGEDVEPEKVEVVNEEAKQTVVKVKPKKRAVKKKEAMSPAEQMLAFLKSKPMR